jgi:hypothetical protein
MTGISRAKAEGKSTAVPEKLLLFASSVAITLLIFAASLIAFAMTCYPAGMLAMSVSMQGVGGNYAGPVLIGGAIILGVVAAGLVARGLGRALWPHRSS